MAAPTKTIDEIVARIISARAAGHPTLRGMWAVELGAAFALSAVLFVDYFRSPLPFSIEFLGAVGPPLKVLMAIALGVEGLLVANRFASHREPSYAVRVQGTGLTFAAAGAVVAGAGFVLRLLWDALLRGYLVDLNWIPVASAALLLMGGAAFLASLPALVGSTVRSFSPVDPE